MNKIAAVAVVIVALGLFVGCSPQPAEHGSYEVIGSIDSGRKTITLYGDIGVVCIESSAPSFPGPAVKNMAAFSCWGVESAPAKLKEIIKNH